MFGVWLFVFLTKTEEAFMVWSYCQPHHLSRLRADVAIETRQAFCSKSPLRCITNLTVGERRILTLAAVLYIYFH